MSLSQNSDGHLLAKLTTYPLEALRPLATHFDARYKEVLIAATDDILRAWKSGNLESLVGIAQSAPIATSNAPVDQHDASYGKLDHWTRIEKRTDK